MPNTPPALGPHLSSSESIRHSYGASPTERKIASASRLATIASLGGHRHGTSRTERRQIKSRPSYGKSLNYSEIAASSGFPARPVIDRRFGGSNPASGSWPNPARPF